MDNIYKILTGVLLFTITSVLGYLFKMHQLYVAAPTLFKRTEVSANGSVCQILIFNRGNHVEEEISVSIDPSLKVELLASDAAGLSLISNTLRIDRLHKGKLASALVLIENGTFDDTKISSVTSKATVGKIVSFAHVPPNFAKLFLAMVALLAFFPGVIGVFSLYDYLSTDYVEYRLKSQYEQGWHNLIGYSGSELRKSYGNQEFPVSFKSIDRSGPRLKAIFEVYNKTAIPLEAIADKHRGMKGDISFFASVTVPPMSRAELSVLIPDPDPESRLPEISFAFRSGDEFIYQCYYTMRVPK